ncbi:MAG: amidohydrolase [Deltaproteobacteria bacterium]|jgi:amidohydrolase|nr:amidohydrolase [Deltaproteobacteria bacterium]
MRGISSFSTDELVIPTAWLGPAILDAAERIEDQLVVWRRSIHEHPELSFHERRTTALVAAALRDAGIEPRMHPEETGCIADIVGDPDGPMVALRADLDALPIGEQTGLSFASKNPGVSHACGHDFHTSMLLGAAHCLLQIREALPGRVRLLFQPAEEVSPGGALQLIERGAMQDVRAILALHVIPSLPAGTIGVRHGAMTAAINNLKITIRGTGGHSARPHQAVDPILIAATVIRELYLAFDRTVDRQDPVVLAFGRFASGTAPNVLPDTAVLEGTLRCASLERQRTAPDLIRNVLRGVTSTWGGTFELEIAKGYPPVINDEGLCDLLRGEARRLFGNDAVREIDRASMGAEDFSYFLQHAPGCMLRLGVGQTSDGSDAMLHTSRFDPDESALPIGSAMLAAGAARWLDELVGD